MVAKYNFDEIVSRRGTNSYKWDSIPDASVLPMWVADMDFRTAPTITDALQRRVAHGIFGYTHVPDAYYKALIDWFQGRHVWKMEKEWILYTSGVVPALSAIIKAMTVPGDKVIVQTPVYNCFFSSILNNGCKVVTNKLIYRDNTYRIDFDDLEQKAADPRAKLLLLCNPHNPAGRVWTKDELIKIGEISLRHKVFVVSDEIHCELVFPRHPYTPFASLSENFLIHSATCTSPTKAFNLAGLQIANITIADKDIRHKVNKAINTNEVCDVNPFGVEALIAAYNESEDWLEELTTYIYRNYQGMKEFCKEYLPQFPIVESEGTYLVWMDCSLLHKTSEDLEHLLLSEAKLRLNAGTIYGMGGEGFMRWNIACPRPVLMEGLKRFRHFIQLLKVD